MNIPSKQNRAIRMLALAAIAGVLAGCSREEVQPAKDVPADAGATPHQAAGCPAGLAGPELVLVPGPGGTSYCMDARETTRGEYDGFLAAKSADLPSQAPECAWNASYTPLLYTPDEWEDMPPYEPYCPHARWNDAPKDAAVSCVDFCDALAYCEWAGKRVCGRIGGPAQWGRVYVAYTSPDGADSAMQTVQSVQSELFNACSQGGVTSYPYGDSYDSGRCLDATWVEQHGADSIGVTATAARDCHGTVPPYDGIHDLSGSVEEWQNVCGTTGATPALSCTLSGGSTSAHDASNPLAFLACASAGTVGMNVVNPYFGFRCCADTLPVALP